MFLSVTSLIICLFSYLFIVAQSYPKFVVLLPLPSTRWDYTRTHHQAWPE